MTGWCFMLPNGPFLPSPGWSWPEDAYNCFASGSRNVGKSAATLQTTLMSFKYNFIEKDVILFLAFSPWHLANMFFFFLVLFFYLSRLICACLALMKVTRWSRLMGGISLTTPMIRWSCSSRPAVRVTLANSSYWSDRMVSPACVSSRHVANVADFKLENNLISHTTFIASLLINYVLFIK